MALIEAQSGPFRKVLLANANVNAFPSRVPVVAEPVDAGTGVINLGQDAALVPKQVLIIPYGLGASNDVFSIRVLGWRTIGNTDVPLGDIWVPYVLGEFACTVGAMTGVAGSPVLNTELFVDTIAVTSEGTYTADVTRLGATRVYSPANDTIAHLILPLNGAQKVEFTFKQTTNTPTMNALVAFGHFD